MHGDFDKLEVLIMFCHTLTVRTVKSVRSIRGSALVHITLCNDRQRQEKLANLILTQST